MATLIRELIDIPERVHKGDFVLKLTEGVTHPRETLQSYVITPELAQHFEEALKFIQSSVEAGTSKATYLHGSFGAGKSHFMAVLHLLLQNVPEARSLPELVPLVSRCEWLGKRRFLLVPYHMIGARNMESAILGGYVDHLRRVHPEAPIPAVYLATRLLEAARQRRADDGDARFFGRLGKTRGAKPGWGKLASGWDAARFEAALGSPPDSEEARRLTEDLLTDVFPEYADLAGGQGLGFLPLDKGLEAISHHARSLGYDGLILFLDELILWLASRAADLAFVHEEGQKLTKLVEAQYSNRPVPIISFVARQRDLRELVGTTITGAEQLGFSDALKHWEGRFDKIALEDRNLPEIASRRVLRPRSEDARRTMDRSFEEVLATRKEVLETLLTEHATPEMFRKVYPFSPALVEVLVAVSSALQRERTALKLMMELLVQQRDTLELGHLIPVGDLFDLLLSGDEAFSDVMRGLADNARRLYREKVLPLLEQEHGTLTELRQQAPQDADAARRLRQFQTDDRLIKTLLLAALAPEVPAMKNLTPARLAALNHGTIQAPIPGFERTVVLTKLKHWIAAGIGEIKLSEDPLNPTVSVQLTGVDVEGILESARGEDNAGNRIRKVRELLFGALEIPLEDSLFQNYRLLWRGSWHDFDLLYGNTRELPDESLRSKGEQWKIILDYPFDPDHSPNDDLARLEEFRESNPEGANTLAWLPNFLSAQAGRDLGTLVVLDYLLQSEDRFTSHAGHLATGDRDAARQLLRNRRDVLRLRLQEGLEMAFGIREAAGNLVDDSYQMSLSDHFQSLHPGFKPRPPARSGGMKHALDGLLDQALRFYYPAHPAFEVKGEIKLGYLRKLWPELQKALESPDGRHLVEDRSLRPALREIVGPLKLGQMHETHLVLERHWLMHFHKKIADANPKHLTVRLLYEWMDQPARMGLPELLQALVVLFFAWQTNRSFRRNGAPVFPDLDTLQTDMVLVEQALPAAEDWKLALERARKVFDLKPLEVLNAGNVERLAEDLRRLASDHVQVACELPGRLEELARLVGMSPEELAGTHRMRTARAASALLESLADRGAEARELVHRAAQAHLASGAEATRASLKSTPDVLEALRSQNLQLLEAAGNWADERQQKGRALIRSVREALAFDDLSMPLAPEVRKAAKAIFDILTVKPPPPPPPPPPDPKPRREVVVSRGEWSGISARKALDQVEDLRRALQGRDGDVQVDLTWTVRQRTD